MFLRIVAGSLKNRKMRIGVAVLAVLLGGTLVSALVSISMEVGTKVGRELRAYGANIVVSPKVSAEQTGIGGLEFGAVRQEKYLKEQDIKAIKSGDGSDDIVAYSPYLFGLVEMGGKKVMLAGTLFRSVRDTSPWWQVTGEWPDDSAGFAVGMVGVNVARGLGLSPGDTAQIGYGDASLSIKITGVVETGGSEENQVFVPIELAGRLLGKSGMVSLVQVSALSSKRSLSEVASSIEGQVPGAQAKVIGQIADAEASILSKIQLLMALVTLLVLLSSGLAVASTMTASVLERTKEIGLMKALGAGNRRVASLFMAETTAIAAVGGSLGYLSGFGLAQIVGQSVFGSSISPHLLAVLATLLVALGVCVVASLIPVRRAMAIDPADTLRGE